MVGARAERASDALTLTGGGIPICPSHFAALGAPVHHGGGPGLHLLRSFPIDRASGAAAGAGGVVALPPCSRAWKPNRVDSRS